MCGIAASFASTNVATTEALEALARLAHRGPDGVGCASLGRATLAHARLAIVDLLGGSQPIPAEQERAMLVCNGEIYNHASLRARLSEHHDFRSNSDSEVVLHLYEDLEAGCVAELDGMFAFVVTDGERFTAARDPFGIKPLYFGRDSGDRLWFASELKALSSRCETLAALPPGHVYTQDGRVARWFLPAWASQVGSGGEPAPSEIVERLERSVQKRLMSDVPMGVLLSGGLDSSVVAALARPHLGPTKSFAVGIPGAPDLDAARVAARAIGTEHFERTYSLQDVRRHLAKIIYHLESYDAALIRSAVACYFVSELASDHVKVVLTGEGADEVFGGYAYFSEIRDAGAFHRECARLLLGLHAMNLQRVDRMTMAHGLEGRVPFLDVEFVDWVMSLAPALKMHGRGVIEKRLLRNAASELLPSEIAHRPKLEFADGSGTARLLAGYAEEVVTDSDLARAPRDFPSDPPQTKEELLYRRLFCEVFPGDAARRTVHRWRPNPSTNGAPSNGTTHGPW